MQQRVIWLYLLVALVELAAEFTGNNMLRLYTKPLLMPLLMLYFYLSLAKPLLPIHWFMLFAFIFSWVGDVALMFEAQHPFFFFLGLVSFLITHILYVVTFSKISYPANEKLLPKKWWVLLPLFAYLGAFVSVIFPFVPGDMKIPVAVYSGIIATMVVYALNRYQRVEDSSFALVMCGALFFMFSDSLIAINKFVFNGGLLFSGVAIMALYLTGQYLIARGILKQMNP